MGYSSSWHDQNRPTPPPLPEDVTTTQYVLAVVSCLNCKVHSALFQINNDDLTVTIRITLSFEYFKSGLITIDLNKSHFRISLSLNEKSNCLSVYLGFSGKRILLHFSIYAWQTTVRVLIVIMNMDSAGICKSVISLKRSVTKVFFVESQVRTGSYYFNFYESFSRTGLFLVACVLLSLTKIQLKKANLLRWH